MSRMFFALVVLVLTVLMAATLWWLLVVHGALTVGAWGATHASGSFLAVLAEMVYYTLYSLGVTAVVLIFGIGGYLILGLLSSIR